MLGEVAAMERVNAHRPAGMPVWIIKFLAAAVTTDVLVVIVLHWTSFDSVRRLLAVVLLAFLVVMPALATWAPKERRRYDWASLLPAYIFLMLATMLFGMRT
jgi:carbon starvation protein CstA